MIQANELRIGNWVNYEQASFRQITMLASTKCYHRRKLDTDDDMDSSLYNDIDPIPLTPEILEKAGFVQHHQDCSNKVIFIKNIFSTPPFEWGVYPRELGSGYIIKDGKPLYYLHQLQNLIFALTGEELQITL